MIRATIATCLILICAVLPVAAARRNQTNQNPQLASSKTPSLDPSELHILSALDQVLAAQQSFADVNLRIVIRVRIAGMLWSYDEPRARGLLKEAFEELARAQSANRSRSGSLAPYRSLPGIVAQAIVARDPDLAVKLAENLHDNPAPNDPASETLRFQLANHLSLRNGEQAAKVAIPIAESGDINALSQMMNRIRFKDAGAANDLFIRALEKIKLGQPNLQQIRELASYLFPSFEGAFTYPPGSSNVDRLQPVRISPKVVEEFIELAYRTVSRSLDSTTDKSDRARSPFDYAVIKLLLPYFDRYIPDRAASIRAYAEDAIRRAGPDAQPLPPTAEWGTIQELLAKADVLTDSNQKDGLYTRASAIAMTNRSLDQAAVIIEKISDERIRENERFNLNIRINQFYPEDAARAVDRNDFDKAEALTRAIQDPAVRLRAFGYLIAGLFQHDSVRALKMLDEARRLAAAVESGVDRSRRLMMLAGIAARVDASRGFEEMKLAIEEFNRAGFSPEWEKGQEPQTQSDAGKRAMIKVNTGVSPLLDDEDFYRLGSEDFDRALEVSRRFEMSEASALAQLAACRGALSKLPSRTQPKSIAPEKQ